MEDGQIGGMFLILSAVAVVEQALRDSSAVVSIQYQNVEAKPAMEQTIERLLVMNIVVQVCSNVPHIHCICEYYMIGKLGNLVVVFSTAKVKLRIA